MLSSQFSLGREITHKDLLNPLISSAVPVVDSTVKKEYETDEESHPQKWHDPDEDNNDDDVSQEIKAVRLSVLRKNRKILTSEWEYWGRPVVFLRYLVYLVIAGLVSANQLYNADDADSPYLIPGLVLYIIWAVLSLAGLPQLFLGGRHNIAWGGPYSVLLIILLNVATISFFAQAFKVNHKTDFLLLLFMAATVFVDKRYIDPVFQLLCWYYQGVIGSEQVGKLPPLSGISKTAVQKIARNAATAIGVGGEAIEAIEDAVDGLKIRQGNEEESLDDWAAIIYKLSKVVSFAPFSCCRSHSAISTVQYRTLVCQMIIYMREYMETGIIEEDVTQVRRSTPLTFAEALALMFKFSMQVPSWFFLAIIPRSLQMAANATLMPLGSALMINSLMMGDTTSASYGFGMILVAQGSNPILLFLANVVESNYSSRMVAQCRRKMFRSLMKGGTDYDETYRPGRVIDAFSNHLTQVLLFAQTFFITLIPNVVGLSAGVVISGALYPFAVVLFFSIVPVVLSVDHFLRKASKASTKKAQTESMVMGKVNSAVECRRAIRACNAGDWVGEDVEDLFESLRVNSRMAWFKSDLARNFMEGSAAFYIVLVLVPLGIEVLNLRMSVGDFIGVSSAMGTLVMPLFLLGQVQSNTMIYSASIRSVRDLMDSSLDEEPYSEEPSSEEQSSEEPSLTHPDQMTSLMPMRDALKVSGVKFRYTMSSPDVLKGVGFNIDKQTYTVICGESGSGKSTVLSLLMRFYKPSEGSVEWDKTSIYETSLASFREHVAVMFQQTMIYQTTIRDNILFGLPEVPGGVEKAAQDAEIADVIGRLPDGYDTVIGGDAVAGMSGGQLQRICMARALYRKPSVLLLDEATSALDKETEHAIIETLVNLRDNNGLTLVSVSHHPETAIKADNIVVLANGVLAEEGTYDDLVSREGGIFRRIVEAGE